MWFKTQQWVKKNTNILDSDWRYDCDVIDRENREETVAFESLLINSVFWALAEGSFPWAKSSVQWGIQFDECMEIELLA